MTRWLTYLGNTRLYIQNTRAKEYRRRITTGHLPCTRRPSEDNSTPGQLHQTSIHTQPLAIEYSCTSPQISPSPQTYRSPQVAPGNCGKNIPRNPMAHQGQGGGGAENMPTPTQEACHPHKKPPPLVEPVEGHANRYLVPVTW